MHNFVHTVAAVPCHTHSLSTPLRHLRWHQPENVELMQETLVDCQCSHMLIQTMQCGTYTKRTCIAAILGLLSMYEREAQQQAYSANQTQPPQQDSISYYAIPSIVKLLSEAGETEQQLCQLSLCRRCL